MGASLKSKLRAANVLLWSEGPDLCIAPSIAVRTIPESVFADELEQIQFELLELDTFLTQLVLATDLPQWQMFYEKILKEFGGDLENPFNQQVINWSGSVRMLKQSSSQLGELPQNVEFRSVRKSLDSDQSYFPRLIPCQQRRLVSQAVLAIDTSLSHRMISCADAINPRNWLTMKNTPDEILRPAFITAAQMLSVAFFLGPELLTQLDYSSEGDYLEDLKNLEAGILEKKYMQASFNHQNELLVSLEWLEDSLYGSSLAANVDVDRRKAYWSKRVDAWLCVFLSGSVAELLIQTDSKWLPDSAYFKDTTLSKSDWLFESEDEDQLHYEDALGVGLLGGYVRYEPIPSQHLEMSKLSVDREEIARFWVKTETILTKNLPAIRALANEIISHDSIKAQRIYYLIKSNLARQQEYC